MSIRRLTAEQLQQLQEGQTEPFVLLDVRPRARHIKGYIPGATHLPLAELKKAVPPLDKNKLIVTYCGGGTSGPAAAELLAAHGYNVAVMEGFRAWEAAGLPVATKDE